MKDVSMAHAKASLSELALRTRGGERFRLLRRGRAVAALVPGCSAIPYPSTGASQPFMLQVLAFPNDDP
jgi:antitoxin (DNA-binding transcriptional repressor) of toxin-antitoxin stability system